MKSWSTFQLACDLISDHARYDCLFENVRPLEEVKLRKHTMGQRPPPPLANAVLRQSRDAAWRRGSAWRGPAQRGTGGAMGGSASLTKGEGGRLR